MRRFICLLFISFLLSGCTEDGDQEVLLVSAAASLYDSLTELEKKFEAEHPSINLVFNFGSTGSLRRQIEQGAPVDVFLSASQKDYDLLIDQKKLYAHKREALFSNRLIVVTREGNDLFSSIRTGKTAIGNPDVTPVGRYARDSLQSLGLWQESQRQLVFAKDVRHVITLLEHGVASNAVIYQSERREKGEYRTLFLPEDSYAPIGYFGGIVASSQQTRTAELFLGYLTKSESLNIFKKHGFIIEDK